MITIRNLTKTYGTRPILKGVSLDVPEGSIVGLVGPNGSGKSTIIRSLLGMVRPDGGDIRVGNRIADDRDENYREMIGYMPQRAALPENLSAREILDMLADIRGRKAVLHTEAFGLNAEMDKPISTLSGGNVQKVLALIAFAFDPSYFVLDEPTAGLDPVAASQLKDLLLSEAKGGKGILITSHILTDLEELADQILFLLEGSVMFTGTIGDMLSMTGERNLERAVAQLMKGSQLWPQNVKS